MKKEFKAANERVYGQIFAGFFGIGCTAWIGRNLVFTNTVVTIVMLGLMLLLGGIIISGLILLKRKIIIDGEKIISTGLFGTVELVSSQVKGYRRGYRTIIIIPKDPDLKKIDIRDSYKEFVELKQWVEQSFVDLDTQETDGSGQSASERERAENLNAARKKTRVLNIVSAVNGAATLIAMTMTPLGGVPSPVLKILLVICLVLPLIGLYIYYSSHGQISMEYNRKIDRPNLMMTFSMPLIMVMPTIYMDQLAIVSYANVFLPAASVLSVMSILFYLAARSARSDVERTSTGRLFFSILAFAAIYAYGSVITTNWVFNTAPPVEYKVKVLEMEESKSGEGGVDYYYKLSEWGPYKEAMRVKIPAHVYTKKKTGDSVSLYLYKGLYDIPYYRLGE